MASEFANPMFSQKVNRGCGRQASHSVYSEEEGGVVVVVVMVVVLVVVVELLLVER